MREIVTFNIAICDDDKALHEEIFDYCDSFFVNKGMSFKAFSYYSAEDIIQEKDKHIDLLFLDVEMSGISGINAMGIIERMPNIFNIIFVSSHCEVAGEAYGRKTMGFIHKPIHNEDLLCKLQKVYNRMISDSIVAFGDRLGEYHFRKSDIIFLEAESNYCKLHTIKGTTIVSYTLKKCEEILSGLPFVRTHKSYLINFNYLNKMSGAMIYLVDNNCIPIGRYYKENVNSLYKQYLALEMDV
ncbi:MAG: LytTR family DNA-binding domain-containing protein [Butyrivibrio hungatei]|nr:LytTR family DNA-binding domain-containing protein [Butyrivibrio hungatei]